MNIHPDIQKILLAATTAMAATMLAACADDDAPDTRAQRPITIGVSQSPSLVLHSSRAEKETIPARMPATIGVFAFIEGNNDRVFDNQKMYYRKGSQATEISSVVATWPTDNLWPYTPEKYWIKGKKYNFYAYAPYDADHANIVASGYEVSSFRMSHIPPISATEFVVCSGMVNVESGTEPTFKMDHLTSRLRFLFAEDSEYLKLRDIHIKSISITDDEVSGTPYWEFMADLSKPTAEFSLTESTENYYSDGPIVLSRETDDNVTELVLTGEYQPFSSVYNLIRTLPSTTLTVVYDVYDKKGVRTRTDQTISNLVNLTQFATLERGHCYDVRILVAPKYLYVLSDNDVPPDCVLEID